MKLTIRGYLLAVGYSAVLFRLAHLFLTWKGHLH